MVSITTKASKRGEGKLIRESCKGECNKNDFESRLAMMKFSIRTLFTRDDF